MLQRTTIPKPADREAWLAVRRPYFNASAAATLFDRHPYLPAGRYVRTKLTGEEQQQTDAMLRGQFLEDAVARWWAQRNEAGVTEADELYVCGRVMATIDRWGMLPGSDPVPVEIKTTNRFTGPEPEEHWLDQCQAILLCTGAPELWLVWLDARMGPPYERRVEADASWQQAIASRAEGFMAFIDMGMVPEGITLDYEDAGKVYPVSNVESVELDIDAKAAVDLYRTARRHRLEWAKREDLAKGIIATAMGSAEVGVWKGEPVVEWRSISPRKLFNLRQFHFDHPELHASYMEEVPQRRLRALGEQEEEAA